MAKKQIFIKSLCLIALFYIFFLSIKLLGSSFKLFGTGFAESLLSLTTNPFVALFIGILATAVVQSSSVSTSVIVGLTASGALTITGAIPMIMGANIGTSITNTIVSIFHAKGDDFRRAFEVATVHDFFNLLVVLVLFPVELIFHPLELSATYLTQFFLGSSLNETFSSPLSAIIKPIASFIQGALGKNPVAILIVALVLLIISLRFVVKVMKPLAESNFKHQLNEHIFQHPRRSFLVGILLTILVQSSSVTTSLVVPLAGAGIVGVKSVFPYILGANIGTTFTAMLASVVTGSPAAVTVALVHVLFNTVGSAIMLPFRKLPINLSRWFAQKTMQSKVVPIAYIVTAFYLVPLAMVWLFG